MSETDYPPKNRRSEELPPIQIEVEHADGTEVFNPTTLTMFLLLSRGTVIEGPLDPAGTIVWEKRDLPPLETWKPVPGRLSDLSKEPAILYRSGDIEVALTPDEMLRYVSLALRPAEFFAVRERYGGHYEIHDDFYDPATGVALQAVFER